MSLIKYRPEIDGLRTIAVLSVIIYHAEFFLGRYHVLQGGFFGVDIFFVISGYLITSIITKELNKTGRFSFSNFYERRTRRLIPVLIFVFILSFPFAWLLLLPDNFVDFSKSIIASSIFLSNFYWYESLQVYGAEASNLKPFLHTWSLAVEEQYYLVFPIIMIIFFKFFKSHIIALLTIATLVSLQFAQFMSGIDHSFSFYLLLSRFWELLIGSLLAYTLHIHPAKENDALLAKTMPSVGLYLIVYSIVFVDYESNNHPGLITLLPIMGTVLIIWFTNKDEFVTKILSNKLFVGIGLISYSLYLWHFPVFSFLRIADLFGSLELKLFSILSVFILSIISYKLIEKPFRSKAKISSNKFFLFIIPSTIIILIMSFSIIKYDGYPERFKGSVADGVKEMEEYRTKYWGSGVYKKIEDFSKDSFSIAVIGDSWAADIANSLIENSNYEVAKGGNTDYRCKAITLNGLRTKQKDFNKMQEICLMQNVSNFKTKLPNTNLVIIADRKWLAMVDRDDIAKETLKNIGLLRDQGYKGPIMIIANRPTYTKLVFDILKEYGAVGNGANTYAKKYLSESPENLNEQDSIAEIFYAKHKIYYYSLVDTLCSDNICKIINNGMPLYHDKGHLTLSGAKYVGLHLVEFIEKNVKRYTEKGDLYTHKAIPKRMTNLNNGKLTVDFNECVLSKPYKGIPLAMYWSGSITTPVYRLEKNRYNLVINARGTKAKGESAKLKIQIFNKSSKKKMLPIYEQVIEANEKFTEFSTLFDIKSNSDVFLVISFINNGSDPITKEDRNIFLRSIVIEEQ